MNHKQFPVIFTLFILLSCQSLYSQNSVIDSLSELVSQEQNDSLKYATLSKLFQETRKVDRNSIVPIAHQMLTIAQKMKDGKRESRAHNLLGFSYLSLSKNDSVIYHSELSNKIASEINDSSYVLSSLNNIALAHQRSNNYEDATITYHQVIDGAMNTGDYRNAVIGLINIASVQMQQDNYKAAVEYLDRVDEIYASIDEDLMREKLLQDIEENRLRGNVDDIASNMVDSIKQIIDGLYPNVYINKGQSFMELGDYDSALDAFEKTIATCQKLDASYTSTYITAYANHSIGDIHQVYAEQTNGIENSARANWLLAEEYYQKGYDGFDDIDFDRGRTFTLNALGNANSNLGNLDKGYAQLSQALSLAEELDFTEEKEHAYQYLANNERKRGEFEQALINTDSFIKYKDALRNEERDQVIQDYEVKYETAQKEKDIIELNLQNEIKTRQQRMQLGGFIIGLISIIGISGLLYSRYRFIQQRKAALYEKEISEAMNRFVPNEFIKAIGRDHILDVKLGDQIEKEISVLFTDIRSFTTISENMSPKENFAFVKDYAERMGPIIRRHGGFINQYLGDGIMAIFQNSPEDALNACIEMQSELDIFNEEIKDKSWAPIRVGMGLHTGPLIMGIIGDESRRDATLISDTVNTAARIESTTKTYGVKILISEDSKNGLKHSYNYHLRHIGEVNVKGKTKPVDIYECTNKELPKISQKDASIGITQA